ncbi:MAG: guanylate kinase [Anaerolineaceae bacterium]|nr:guanylate kinase [Anaerolineaceae bacterium]
MNTESLSFDLLQPKPILIVISGTSGVGKDAVIKCLKSRNLPLHFVVTATSRPPRPDEVHGRDYFFYPPAEFEERIKKGEFIEHAMVYDEHKGIPRSQVEEALKSGKDVVAKVDIQGAATLRRLYPQAVVIFLVPRTVEEWLNRLKRRNTETEEKLKTRIETAKYEVSQIEIFDYIVVNAEGEIDKAADDIIDIINAEHHRVVHRKPLE